MASKLVWGLVGGTALGAVIGTAAGNTPMGIAICCFAGAVAAGLWHYFETRAKK